MELEIDITRDVLDFDPVPPKRTWLDYVPSFLVHFIRRRGLKLAITPRETWFVSLHFVRVSLTTLMDLEKARNAQLISHTDVQRDVPQQELN